MIKNIGFPFLKSDSGKPGEERTLELSHPLRVLGTGSNCSFCPNHSQSLSSNQHPKSAPQHLASCKGGKNISVTNMKAAPLCRNNLMCRWLRAEWLTFIPAIRKCIQNGSSSPHLIAITAPDQRSEPGSSTSLSQLPFTMSMFWPRWQHQAHSKDSPILKASRL